jgi:hypothetical protein
MAIEVYHPPPPKETLQILDTNRSWMVLNHVHMGEDEQGAHRRHFVAQESTASFQKTHFSLFYDHVELPEDEEQLEQVRALFRRGTAEDDVIQVDKHQDSLNTILSITLCNVFPVLHRSKGRR